jgi:hypothetical protein
MNFYAPQGYPILSPSPFTLYPVLCFIDDFLFALTMCGIALIQELVLAVLPAETSVCTGF